MNKLKLRNLVQQFLIEDIGDTDITSESIFPPKQPGHGVFIAKDSGVVAGLEIIEEAYMLLNPSITVEVFFQDGDQVRGGDVLAEAHGPIVPLLAGERVILNLIQRMSGIATITARSVSELNNPSIHICDTRKTTPGLRMFDKYAVTCGGGRNHRFGLEHGVMIKDNHISFAGSITKAVHQVREKVGHMVKIEVETETKEEVLEAVEAGADIIMFDNRSPAEVIQFNKYVPDSIITEASGGITLDNLATYQHTGVDYISLGFLTHSVTALDISLQVKPGPKKSSAKEQ
ncbi:carboxylating nicotinate-nucleotide diphosphorylase [Virgibacillus halodenitrificans]|uniref:nicotinate-nucleotide diphosphorylase (carboxylating) n=1 Tax=Virgibacillus halodenitrificans TaxID=1482 RepID=A0ABR7VKH6_VIRHA|nr:carboxylating nicotinate-nucleotide diphosphorylase [Virgibacillus halodenitrificans]MBD1222420.1 carboxylating nicotinate-nucleotide diphosphorylase [Virgibacillus halodenitrificans]MYL59726.1 carboxylating nicotinate-nucleotide diphosphorylase [Virgibacillus halodenitrificans]